MMFASGSGTLGKRWGSSAEKEKTWIVLGDLYTVLSRTASRPLNKCESKRRKVQ